MNINKTKDAAYYEALPYTVVVRKDEDGDFVARINELPGCLAHGPTEASAVENVHSMQRLWIENALVQGDAIPEPEHEPEMPSGKWVQRVPRKLHKDLARLAERENVSLNQLVTSMLSEGVALRSCAEIFKNLTCNATYVGVNPAEMIDAWWGWDKPQKDVQWIGHPSALHDREHPFKITASIAHARKLNSPQDVFSRDLDFEDIFQHHHASK